MTHTKSAEWVLNFLKSMEAGGKHAPVETMTRVADSQAELLEALKDLLLAADYYPINYVHFDVINRARDLVAKQTEES